MDDDSKIFQKKAASILNWALVKEDIVKSPPDPGKPSPRGAPRMCSASRLSPLPLLQRDHSLGSLPWWGRFPPSCPKSGRQLTCVIEISEEGVRTEGDALIALHLESSHWSLRQLLPNGQTVTLPVVSRVLVLPYFHLRSLQKWLYF